MNLKKCEAVTTDTIKINTENTILEKKTSPKKEIASSDHSIEIKEE